MISVAMASYNGEAFIREQIDSILNQNVKVPLELVVCDDCSTDSTKKILLEYSKKDERVRVFFNKKNIGFKKNFEKAVSLCKGEFIAFSDQDDIWELDKLEKLVNHIGDKDFVFSDSLLVDKNNVSMGVTMKNACNYRYVPVDKLQLFKRLVHQNFVQGSTMLARSQFLKTLPPIPDFVDGHDYWHAICSCAKNGFAYFDQCTIRYRRHDTTASNVNKKAGFLDELKIKAARIDALQKKLAFNKDKALFCRRLLESPLELPLPYRNYLQETIKYYEGLADKNLWTFVYFAKNVKFIYLDKSVIRNLLRLLKNFAGLLFWKLILKRQALKKGVVNG